ncbi:hypothetical protein L1887_17455 [Cichorium endivia]|nr:hypothetical protein L1887_17455 [Cichorium endivia]
MEGSIIASLPTEQSKGTNPGHPDNHYPLPYRNHLPTNQSDQTACYNRISNSREHDPVSRRGPDTPDQHEPEVDSRSLNNPSASILLSISPCKQNPCVPCHHSLRNLAVEPTGRVVSSARRLTFHALPFYTKTRLSRSHYCQGPKLKRNTIAQRSPHPNGNNQNSHGGDHASLAWPRSLSLCNAYNLQQLH